MKKEQTPKTVYYRDELNDDFANNGIVKKNVITNDYRYINKSPFFKVLSFLVKLHLDISRKPALVRLTAGKSLYLLLHE